MPKTKLPLFSFDAKGSLANSLTFAHTLQGTVAKRIPSHVDAHTLPQMYQRWAFIDAKHYWRSLTQTQRDTYETDARAFHITGWSYFLGQYLLAPFDLLLWVRLDGLLGNLEPDYSPHANNGTVFGATPTPAQIFQGRRYDGVDDYISCGNDNSLNLLTDFTVMTWVYVEAYDTGKYSQNIVCRTGWGMPWGLRLISSSGRPQISLKHAEGFENIAGLTPITPGSFFHVAATVRQQQLLEIFVNGRFDSERAIAILPDSAPDQFTYLGHNIQWLHGILDDSRIYSRPLSHEHIFEIFSQELWSPP